MTSITTNSNTFKDDPAMDRRADDSVDPDTEWDSSLMNGDREMRKRVAMRLIKNLISDALMIIVNHCYLQPICHFLTLFSFPVLL